MDREIKFRAYLDASEYAEHFPEVSRMLSWDDLIDHTDPLQAYFNNEILGCSPVMQYTGLKDKNGVEIYEWDILDCRMSSEHHSLPHRGKVVWHDDFGAFATENDAGKTLLHNHALNTFEVIGNIYENPELLEINNG